MILSIFTVSLPYDGFSSESRSEQNSEMREAALYGVSRFEPVKEGRQEDEKVKIGLKILCEDYTQGYLGLVMSNPVLNKSETGR